MGRDEYLGDEEERIKKEHRDLRKAGKLHWIHWAVVISSLGLTLFAWQIAKSQTDKEIEGRFQHQTKQVADLVIERMQKYEDALWGGVGAIHALGVDNELSYQAWLSFANSLQIDKKYPGINGIGVILPVAKEELPTYLEQQRQERPDFHIHPKHGRQEYLPITFIEPVATNRKAVGLDMAHETNRYTAAVRARETGTTQITGPIVLVQDSKKTPGFLFYAPYYEGGKKGTPEVRVKNFKGLVYAPFIVSKLMEGTLAKQSRQVGLSILDGDQEIYSEHSDNWEDYDHNPMFKKKISISLYGRNWVFDIWAAKSFREASSQVKSSMILVGGIIIDSLLFLLFVMLSRANRRAVSFANRMTEHLRQRTIALERSNGELEKFAYITSHDLKSPLRGIGDLTEYLKEDLEEYFKSSNVNPDIEKNFYRIDKQLQRMEGLIQGILEYSSVEHHEIKSDRLDLNEIVVDCLSGTGLTEAQVSIPVPLPKIESDKVQLEQVFTNLLSNAFKYHHQKESAKVEIRWQEQEDFYRFSVADNGPGIESSYHSKIFEVFQTLHSRDIIESTGVGLSVVKKVVESHGGRVGVDSTPGKGSTFTFEWPKKMEGRKRSEESLLAHVA